MKLENIEMKNIKAVNDTSVWVSYIITGELSELVRFVAEKDVTYYTSDEATTELKDVLSRNKFKQYLSASVDEYIHFYKRLSEIINIRLIFNGCVDPKDNFLFDIAYQSNAQYIVTGDKKVQQTKVQLPLNCI